MTNFKYKPIGGVCRIPQPLKGGDNPIQCRLLSESLPHQNIPVITLLYLTHGAADFDSVCHGAMVFTELKSTALMHFLRY